MMHFNLLKTNWCVSSKRSGAISPLPPSSSFCFPILPSILPPFWNLLKRPPFFNEHIKNCNKSPQKISTQGVSSDYIQVRSFPLYAFPKFCTLHGSQTRLIFVLLDAKLCSPYGDLSYAESLVLKTVLFCTYMNFFCSQLSILIINFSPLEYFHMIALIQFTFSYILDV